MFNNLDDTITTFGVSVVGFLSELTPLDIFCWAFAFIAVALLIFFFGFQKTKTTASGRVVAEYEDPIEIDTQEDEGSDVEDFASEMKKLFDALVSVGFDDDQALTLIETTERVCWYDDAEEFAKDLRELFDALVTEGFSDEHAIRLVPFYWDE